MKHLFNVSINNLFKIPIKHKPKYLLKLSHLIKNMCDFKDLIHYSLTDQTAQPNLIKNLCDFKDFIHYSLTDQTQNFIYFNTISVCDDGNIECKLYFVLTI